MADFTVSTDLDTFMQSADKAAMRTNMDLGTAATKDVAATGDAASGEVVKGDDTRLTDARTPTSHTHTASEVTDFDTEVANNTTVAANTSKLAGIEAGAEVNNISDVNATDLTDGGDSTLHYHAADRARANHTGTQTLSTISDAGTAASKDVPATGDAGAGEVVLGNDSRLTDARTPTSHTHTASEITDFDTEVANNTTVAANTSKLSGIEAGAEVNNISDANATDLTDGGDSSLHYHSADRNRSNHTGTQTLSTISDAGTIASQDANSVNITGGSVTGITDLAIADGGTGAGTASGARTNLDVYSTGEVDEYLAPKATAGGVRFSTGGEVVVSDNATTGANFDQAGNVLTYSWVGNASQQTFRQHVYVKSLYSNNAGGAIEIYHNENTTSLNVLLRQTGVFTGHYGKQWSNIIDGTFKHYVLKVDYTGTDPVMTLAVNGVDAGTGTVYVSKSGTFDDSSAYYVRIGALGSIDTSKVYGGVLRDFAIFNRALSASEVADLYRNGLAGIADADRWGVPGTSTGCIAAYPMDEGIGYQLHDISSNHYDGLLSTSGFTHLVPKTEGKARVKAANASSAMYMLRAGDIIPTNSIVRNVLSEDRFVDLTNSAQTLDDYRIRLEPSGSDLLIRRSDGSNHQTLGTVTAPSSLSDVDVEIQYTQVAR